MIYLTLDTDVWLGLLATSSDIFEEILFQLERKHVTSVSTENLKREWSRHKEKKKKQVVDDLKKLHEQSLANFRGNPEIRAAYTTDGIAESIDTKINRIDYILNSIAEIAPETDNVYIKAAQRTLNRIAPNHHKDSFCDTVNIISLASFLAAQQYKPCYFSTINYTDFSDPEKKYSLHPSLEDLFKSSNLEYIFFEDHPQNFASPLLRLFSKHALPSYSDHLKQQREAEEQRQLEQNRMERQSLIAANDEEFLDNTRHLDRILARKTLNSTDREILEVLLKKGDAYRQYFLKNVSPDGMV
jgi:hypothetical protein